MAPLLKEKTEATNTAAEAGSPVVGRTAADHLSADAVSLEVPVNIHGSRVTDTLRGAAPNTEPFEEQTTTMIVFPQGGVLRMSTPVTTGQMLVLTNLKSRQDAICRVVKVRSYANAASYVEVEFTHPQAGYWGVFFSSDAPELAKKAPSALSLDAAELSGEQKPVANPAQPPAAVPTQSKDPLGSSPSSQRQIAPSGLGIPANRNESSFISIGSQEEVQLSASSTTFKSGSRIASDVQRPATPSKNQPVQQARAISEPRETPSLTNSLATETTAAEREKSAPAVPGQSSGDTFAEDLGGNSHQATVRDTQSRGLEPGLSTSSPATSQNWKLIAGGATLGIVLAGGAFFLMRPSANGSSVAKPAPAPAAEVQPAVTQPAAPTPAQSTVVRSTSASAVQTPPAAPKNNLLAEAKRAESAAAPNVKTPQPEEAPAVEPARSTPTAKYNVPDVTSDLFGSLNAHPVAGRSEEKNQTDVAPAVEQPAPAPLNAGNASPIIPAQSVVALPVPTQSVPGSPLQAGGAVPEPRLLSSTLPIYPAAAQQTRTEGAVVVRALVNERGQVTDAQAVSGPALLRQAAVEAVKHWKYEPSHVNGKPVAVQTLVTIHFRL